MELPKPLPEHQWLEQLVGNWDFDSECQMGPDQPAMKTTGRQTNRSLGGLWMIGEMTGEMPGGGEAQSIFTLGFNPESKRFTGTFVSSCMTHLWQYDGALDAGGKALRLDAEGPSCVEEGTMGKYQDVFEIVNVDEHLLHSQCLKADGTWMRFMNVTYRRRKCRELCMSRCDMHTRNSPLDLTALSMLR